MEVINKLKRQEENIGISSNLKHLPQKKNRIKKMNKMSCTNIVHTMITLSNEKSYNYNVILL